MDWHCFSNFLLVGWRRFESEVVQRSTLSPWLPFILQFFIMIMSIIIIFIPGSCQFRNRSQRKEMQDPLAIRDDGKR